MNTPSRCLVACVAAVALCGGCLQRDASPVASPTATSGLTGATKDGPDGASSPAPAAAADPAAKLVPLTLGLPYKPDVQFTPLYVAQAKRHFAEQGLEVTLQYGDESQFLRLLAAGDLDATIASGEQVILARGAGVPVKYVMTWYQRFAGVVFSLDPELDSPQSLAGRRVGLPVQSGASYIGWLALLAASDIDPASVPTEVIGFSQLAAVLGGRVEAAVGYAANEPVQLRAQGHDVTVIDIAEYFNLVSNGLVVSDRDMAERPEVITGLVQALLGSIRDCLLDPNAAFAVALEYVPEAADGSVRERQRAVLEASMPYWVGDPAASDSLGAIDAEAWSRSQDFLAELGLLTERSPIQSLVDARFVESADIDVPRLSP